MNHKTTGGTRETSGHISGDPCPKDKLRSADYIYTICSEERKMANVREVTLKPSYTNDILIAGTIYLFLILEGSPVGKSVILQAKSLGFDLH